MTYKTQGMNEQQAEDIWRAIGAKVCVSEITDMNIIPLNEPELFLSEGDEAIIQNLANRVLGIIRFESIYKDKPGYKSQFHPSAFKHRE